MPERSEALALLQVRPAEARKTFVLGLLMMLTAAGGAIASPGVEALFYARFGVEFLPHMYMALGVVTGVTSLVITGLLGRVPKFVLYRWFPLVMAAVWLAARALLAVEFAWLYPALWLTTYLTWTLQFFVIWGLAGSIFDTRQAKRLFPLLASGGILGSAAGGLVTRVLVPLVGAENLLLAWALAFALAFVLIQELRIEVRDAPAGRRRRPALNRDLRRGYRAVVDSELLRWMSWSALLLGVLLFAVMFPFSKAVARAYPNENELAAFLGVFQGSATVVALLTSLFLANRLYARLGFMGGLVGFAVIYMVGFALLVFWPVFAAFAALRLMQFVWRLGIADTAFQGLFNVVPSGRREPARAFIDGAPRQAGIVLAGALLLLTESALQPVHSYLLGVGLAVACLYVLWRARGAYRAALAEALRAGRPQVFFPEDEPFGGFQNDSSAVAAVVEGISDPDPAIRRVAAEILGNIQSPDAARALVAALGDPDPEVRAALVNALAKAGVTAALLDIPALLRDPEPQVRLRAVEALRDLAGYPPGLREMLVDMLDDPSPEVRSRSAVAILRTGQHWLAGQTLRSLQSAADPQTRLAVLESVADWLDPLGFQLAANSLRDAHPSVRRAAARAVGSSTRPEGLPLLIERLEDEDRTVHQAAANALSAYGPWALAPALQALQDPKTETGALLALRNLPINQGAGRLHGYALRKQARALAYHDLWRGLHRIAQDNERLDLLSASVRSASRRQARLAIEALGILGDLTAALLAIENLESDDRAQRANALEVVESLGDHRITAPLIRIWDDAVDQAGPVLEPWECLERALRDQDAWVRACAALAAGELRHPSLEPDLRQIADSDPDPMARQAAYAVLSGESPMQALPTLSIMERILFLRHVPLFADLPPNELKQIAAIARELVFSDQEEIATQGDRGDEMFIIVHGEVRVIAEDVTGLTEELARREPGEYVGEMSIISHEPRMASLLAEGEVRVLCIGQKEFEGILRERPETSLAVMRELIARLKATQAGPVH